MNQGQGRVLDELARLMIDGVELAQDAGQEIQTFFRSRVEEILARMDLVRREEFEVVVEMASRAREENEVLRRELEALGRRMDSLNKDKSENAASDKKPV